MAAIPNPNNGYTPKTGEMVRVIGNCHPRLLGKVGRVIRVLDNYADIEYEDPRFGTVITCGALGGLEPVQHPQEQEDT